MIRKITESDRAAYLAMARDFYHSPAVLHAVPDEHFERCFHEMMAGRPYLEGLIFEQYGAIAGYALLSKTYSQEAGGLCVWIEEIYVLPELRKKGLDKAFFHALPRIIPAARYRLEIEPDNTRAERLYRSMGFEPMLYRQLVMEGND